MLRFLRIQQLAVIDTVEVEFGPGFKQYLGHRSPVAWSSESNEARRQMPMMELSLLL